MTGRSGLARTSRTPGRTQELIFFDLHGQALLVDMPGYGYAAASKAKAAAWGELARDYLRGRPTLLRVFVLVDGRHGLKESDQETMRLLDAAAVSYAIVLTKGDEVKAADKSARIAATLEGVAQARRRLPRGHVHVRAHRRGNRGFARPYRTAYRGAKREQTGTASANSDQVVR